MYVMGAGRACNFSVVQYDIFGIAAAFSVNRGRCSRWEGSFFDFHAIEEFGIIYGVERKDVVFACPAVPGFS